MNKYRSRKAGENILRTYDALMGQWGVRYREEMIKTRYGATHVTVAGAEDAPPVVLFHGVGDDSALMWIYNAEFLARRYRIYAVDTIGGPGKSEMGPGYDKAFDDATWIDETLDGLNVSRASVVGVSHGGYLAKLYAIKRPERVDKVISVSAAVAAGEGGSPMKTMLRIFMPEALFPTKANVERLIKKLSGERYDVFTGNALIMEHYGWLLKGFNNMAMGFHKVSGFKPADIDALRPKAFFLVGDEDPFMKLGGKQVLIDNRMNARFYPRAGHGLNHELSEVINQTIDDILAGRVVDLAK